MEVRVNGASFAVIMRTPGADRDLAAGFLLAEDVIRSADEIGTIEYCQDVTDEGRDNTINVTVTGDAIERLSARLGERRQVMMTASCGLCGRRTIESLQARVTSVAGDWTIEAGDIVSNQPAGGLAFRFHARDVNLVLRARQEGTPLPFRVSVDGEPPGEAAGLDVDRSGAGTIEQPRLYQLIRERAPAAERTVEIEFAAPGAEAYVFTFG